MDSPGMAAAQCPAGSVTFKDDGFRQNCPRSGRLPHLSHPTAALRVFSKNPSLHPPPIRASSRAFPAGGDGIAPGYVRIPIMGMRPLPVVDRDKP